MERQTLDSQTSTILKWRRQWIWTFHCNKPRQPKSIHFSLLLHIRIKLHLLLNKYLAANDNHKINKNCTSYNTKAVAKRFLKTRIHSSRMHTDRFSTDPPSEGRPPSLEAAPPQKEHGTRQEVTSCPQKEHGTRQEVTSYPP